MNNKKHIDNYSPLWLYGANTTLSRVKYRQIVFSLEKEDEYYKNFARKSGVRQFTPEVKNQMREEFARQHCLKQTLQKVAEGYDLASLTAQATQICTQKRLRKKKMQRRARLF